MIGVKELAPAHYEMNGPDIETPVYEISGYDAKTARKLRQMPFAGEVVGKPKNRF